ncbi:sphingosine kinase 2-like isoform X1 [Schistocerca gregaria]|uniref:sphingosine kinase 2-like isoform X1 n=1 Tax=Schistocerca gregaria TaxID=7010 RepID=UPI00211E706D|nr:sphingosine kinase 2-like isoform X1 [Schistocerca gregaria]
MEGGNISGGPVLEETFYILSKKNTVYRVKLTEKGLSLQKESNGNTKTETIRINDIVGCRCMRSKRRSGKSCACHPSSNKRNDLRVVEENSSEQDETDISAYLYIYAYVLKKIKMKSGQKRERMTITLRFRSFDRYEDNMKEAQKWRIALKCLIRNKPVPRNILTNGEGPLTPVETDETDPETGFTVWDVANLNSRSIGSRKSSSQYGDEQEQRVLVLLNPKSGPGRARDVFQQRVVPVFAEAEIPFDLHVTKHAGYARDFVRSRDIYQWRAIVVVGGDGILFEVINGLFERPDWQQAFKEIGIGIIPCGSGNGLAKTIAYIHEEPFDQNPVLISTLNIIKAKKVPMDLVRVETKSQIMFSFLSVGWGLLSDIDIESEKLRAIGGQRFTVWSVARLIGLRTYRGRLSYEPVEDGLTDDKNRIRPSEALLTRSSSHYPTETVSTMREHTNGVPSEGRLQAMHASRSFDFGALPDDFLDEPDTLTDSLSLETAVSQGMSDLDSPGSTMRPRLDSYYSANSRYSAYFSTADSSYRSVDVTIAGDGSPHVVYGPPSRLPALTQPVPSHWKTIEGDFVLVHASYQTHLGSDCLFAPSSKLDDGIIWLLIIRAGITRTQLLQFLLGLSSGSHLSCPRAEMIPVTAFRLEPESTRGHLTVDGELVDYGPVQAELMPSLANIMSR